MYGGIVYVLRRGDSGVMTVMQFGCVGGGHALVEVAHVGQLLEGIGGLAPDVLHLWNRRAHLNEDEWSEHVVEILYHEACHEAVLPLGYRVPLFCYLLVDGHFVDAFEHHAALLVAQLYEVVLQLVVTVEEDVEHLVQRRAADLLLAILGKCDILCLCSFFRNTMIFNAIFNDMDKKLELLKLLINFVAKHKEESVKTHSKWTKSDLDCAFVDSDEEKSDNEYDYEDEDSEFDYDNSFNENVKKCFKNHCIINNYDEFKIFSETFYQIKSNNEALFNKLIENFSKKEKKILNDLLFVRNVKVEYKGKELDVPRRTLKIKRTVH